MAAVPPFADFAAGPFVAAVGALWVAAIFLTAAFAGLGFWLVPKHPAPRAKKCTLECAAATCLSAGAAVVHPAVGWVVWAVVLTALGVVAIRAACWGATSPPPSSDRGFVSPPAAA